jgi:hypothetical protein
MKRMVLGIGLLGGSLALALGPSLVVDQAVKESPWREPYGGCKEAAQYPDTRGYRECLAHGLLP